MKTPKLFTLLVRQPDGSWARDEVCRRMKECRELERINRCLGGISSRILPATADEISEWQLHNGD